MAETTPRKGQERRTSRPLARCRPCVPARPDWPRLWPSELLTIFQFLWGKPPGEELRDDSGKKKNPPTCSAKCSAAIECCPPIVGSLLLPLLLLLLLQLVQQLFGFGKSERRPDRRRSLRRKTNGGDGGRAASCGRLIPPPAAFLAEPRLVVPVRVDIRPAAVDTPPPRLLPRRPRHTTQPPVSAVPTARHMGFHSEGSAEEEDVTFEEETQTDGGESITRRHVAVQMPGLWQGQEDALPLSVVPEV